MGLVRRPRRPDASDVERALVVPYLTLVAAAAHHAQAPETRLWALDRLAFNDAREGRLDAAARVGAMRAMLDLGARIPGVTRLGDEADAGPDWRR